MLFRQIKHSAANLRSFSTGRPNTRRRYVAGGLVAGTALLYAVSPAFREDVDFTLHAGQRSATVALALGKCVWFYRRALSAHYDNKEDREEAIRECHKRCALITRSALERNAGVFIKLGQHISALTYILPDEWTQTMIPLQDQCPVSSFESVKELVSNDTGKTLSEIFSDFEKEPMGTASLAQVHRATLTNGQEVAVKVQHPELKKFVPLDIRLTSAVFKMVDFFFPQYPLLWLSDEMRTSLAVELDFEQEAHNAELTAAYFKKFYNETALRIPKVYWAQKRLLCMEFLRGIRPDHREELEAAKINLRDVSLCFSNIFNNMIFTPHVGLHCDPHAGNIAIRPCNTNKHGFEVILYDHGLYRYVETDLRVAYARFWLSLMDRDVEGMRIHAKEFAHIDDDDFKVFAAAITGRDFDNSVDGSVFSKPRTKAEIQHMQSAVQSDSALTSQIMQMLHKMPRVVLLILKTNDLVRYLDEKLGSPLGVTREFIIMAKYCSLTIFSEERKTSIFKAWFHYIWTQIRLITIKCLMT